MTPGYSRLLLNEQAITPRSTDPHPTTMDLLMAAVCAGKERSEQEWKEMLGQARLKVVKIWRFENGMESLIEAELA